MKKLQIRIYPNGQVEAETKGIKGKACLNYISIMEQLTGAKTVDSEFTPEYRESEVLLTEDTVEEVGLHG